MFDDGGSDDDAVGDGGDGSGLVRGGDAEADADGGVGVLADSGDEFCEIGGEGAVCAGDAGA